MEVLMAGGLQLLYGDVQGSLDWFAALLSLPPYILNLLVTVLVVILVCLLVQQLSRQLSQRDLFSMRVEERADKATSNVGLRKVFAFLLYALKYVVLFPIYIVVWGLLFVLLLLVLANNKDYNIIIFGSTVIVAVVRAMAYYKESFAEELAKVLPLWLLVTILLDPQILFSLDVNIDVQILLHDSVLVLSVGFLVVEEWLLRMANMLRTHFFSKTGS